MVKRIELDAPNISDLEKQHLCKCLDLGFVSTFGPFVPEFEEKFAEYLGVKKAVSTQSGTAAIHMALHELGIGKGDEVIVPALTFIATVNPIIYTGAKPVIVDVHSETWTIDPDKIRKAITTKTKAVIGVHLYGNPCQMSEILEIAEEAGIYVIEDATESLGGQYDGKHVGTLGDFGCFSFNGNKIITTGGGGMVVGKDTRRLGHIKFLVNQAKHLERSDYHPEIGFNYRMTNIEASLGLAQMERLESFLATRKKINSIYKEELREIDGISFQEEYNDTESSCWLTCVTFEKGIDVSNVQRELKKQSIPTRRIFMPIVEFPPYQMYKCGDYKNSYHIYQGGLCLPSSTLNCEDDIRHVCKSLKAVI